MWINKKMISCNSFAIHDNTLISGINAWDLSVLDLKSLNLNLAAEPARDADYKNLIYDQGRYFWFDVYGGFVEFFPDLGIYHYNFLIQGLPEEKLWDRYGYRFIHPVDALTKCGKWFFCSTWQGLYLDGLPTNGSMWQLDLVKNTLFTVKGDNGIWVQVSDGKRNVFKKVIVN
jgi:hypothetical protein